MSEQTNSELAGFPSDVLVDLRSGNGLGLRQQLEHGLRSAIQQRRLVAGTRLPPTRVLAAELGVSRSVIVETYANLTADGYLEARQGAGTRVRHDAQHAKPRSKREKTRFDRASFFERSRQPAPLGPPGIRMIGGLPDPTLFPRSRWVRHYRDALAELPDPELTYPSTLGAEPLREALAAYLGRVRGVCTATDRMLVCTGYTQGVTLIARALHRAGARRVAVEDPCFGLHRRSIAMTGIEPVPIRTDDQGLDPAALEHQDVDAVLVAPAHSYPTGGTLDTERRAALIDWAERRGALIVEDDYDAEFRYDRMPVGALQGLAPDRVIYIGGASKTVSPALRLGWMAVPASLVRPLEREKRFDDMGSPLFEQLAFARFIDSGDFARFLRRVRPIYRRRRDATIAALEQFIPEARWQGAAAGLHLWVELPPEVDENELSIAAFDRGTLLEAAAWHWARPGAAPPSIVLGYGSVNEATIRLGIQLIAAAIDDLKRIPV
jgi:GntR family transcriptional regulator/MocR family aminotransferase